MDLIKSATVLCLKLIQYCPDFHFTCLYVSFRITEQNVLLTSPVRYTYLTMLCPFFCNHPNGFKAKTYKVPYCVILPVLRNF
jgi:hypothetical protein